MTGMRGPLKKILLIAIVLIAALFLFLGEGMRMPDLVGQLLIAACGAYFIKRGVDQVLSRSAFVNRGTGSRAVRTYSGWAAVARGTGLVLGGSAILTVALYFAMGREEMAWGLVKAHPGPALLFAAAFLASWSLSMVIGAEEERARRSIWLFFLAIPKRTFSLAILAAALALVGVGLADIAAPGLFRTLIGKLAALVARRGF